jgi:hypothetical protein
MITLLNQPWTERLGWTLLHFLWQGILVAALYALARALAGGRISARGRYAIACASLLAMSAAPAVTYWWLGNSGQARGSGTLPIGAPGSLPLALRTHRSPIRGNRRCRGLSWRGSLAPPRVPSGCSWDSSPRRLCGVRSCAGAHRMAANPRPADRTHARVAKRAVAGPRIEWTLLRSSAGFAQ